MTLNVEIYSAVTINYSLSELFFHPYQLNKEICTNDKKKNREKSSSGRSFYT